MASQNKKGKVFLNSLFALASEAILSSTIKQLNKRQPPTPSSYKVPPKKKNKVDSSALSYVEIIDPKALTGVEVVRAQLDEYLVSWYSCVRHDLIQQFLTKYYCSCCQPGEDKFNQNLLVSFMDSVMDKSFTCFTLPEGVIPQISHSDLTQLLKIISFRSPQLENLNISLGLPLGPEFALSLANFTHLTYLTLSSDEGLNNTLKLFSHLGHSCPQLESLHLAKIAFGVDQVLALILGDKQALLPPDFPSDALKLMDLQFSPASLTPICFSLKELNFFCDESKSVCQFLYAQQNPPTALLLRHFRKLEKIGRSACKHPRIPESQASSRNNKTAVIIQHWHEQQCLRKSPRFQGKKKSNSSEKIGLLEWTIDAPFIGQLDLVQCKGVNISSLEMMQAVTSICPRVIMVEFNGLRSEAADDFLTHQELRTFLVNSLSRSSCWSKIVEVNFTGCVQPDYRLAVLSVIGHQLLRLRYSSSSLDIDVLSELGFCPRLRDLTFSYHCTLLPLPLGTDLQKYTNDFLPQLDNLKSASCLGEWSPLFECHRPSLTLLILACPHLGLATRSKFNWPDAPLLWPNLRNLKVAKCDGLTVDMLREVVPQWEHLDEFILPLSIVSKWRNDIFKIAWQMRNRVPSGPNLYFYKPISFVFVHH